MSTESKSTSVARFLRWASQRSYNSRLTTLSALLSTPYGLAAAIRPDLLASAVDTPLSIFVAVVAFPVVVLNIAMCMLAGRHPAPQHADR